MTATIEVPVWLVVVASLLAMFALLDRFLVPSWRWFLRNRANRVLEDVSARLRMQVRPFQQTSRQGLIDRLIFDEKVQQAIFAHAEAQQMPREVALDEARRYAREIVPAFNAYLYFRIGYWAGKSLSRSLYRVRIGYTDEAGLAKIPPNATVVFVMNHRSNMDYVLAAYLAADQAALSYAVGEWARVWPVQQIIRSLGGYFVRRNSKDELYRRVLERYIAMATEAGVTQAVYPEGGLSRDGLLRAPRFGVIDYMLRGFGPQGERDLVFVPLGLNYDRVLEDRTLLRDTKPDAKPAKRSAAILNTAAFVGNQLWLMLRSRWHRFGYACVNFGTPISMREYVAARGIDFKELAPEDRRREVAALGTTLMSAVGDLIPVLPVPLAAAVLLDAQAPISELELKSRVATRVAQLEANGARIYLPRGDWDYAVTAGLRMLTQRHLVAATEDGLFQRVPAEDAVLRYYANSIAHLRSSE